MSDKFQLLLKQIRFPEDHDAFKEIKDGSIETVKLFKSKRQWFFVFSFRMSESSPRSLAMTRRTFPSTAAAGASARS